MAKQIPDNYEFVVSLRALRSYRGDALRSEDLDAIVEAARWTGSSKNRQNWSFVVITDAEQMDRLASCGDFTDPVRAAVATIVLVREPGGTDFDIGRAAQNIMLAAKARGVASCPITLHRDTDARSVLGVPDDRTCRYAVALGYPADDASPRRFGGRKPAAEIVHHNHYS